MYKLMVSEGWRWNFPLVSLCTSIYCALLSTFKEDQSRNQLSVPLACFMRKVGCPCLGLLWASVDFLIALYCHGFCLELLGMTEIKGKEILPRGHCAFLSKQGSNMKNKPSYSEMCSNSCRLYQILGYVVYQLLILCLIKHTEFNN